MRAATTTALAQRRKMNNAQKVLKYTATHAKVWEELGKTNDDVICDKHRT